jgi:signal transduction histidine kinase
MNEDILNLIDAILDRTQYLLETSEALAETQRYELGDIQDATLHLREMLFALPDIGTLDENTQREVYRDLRDPMNTIMGFADLLKAEVSRSLPEWTYIDEISTACAYILQELDRLF